MNPHFNEDGLVPAVVQDQKTKDVLMVAYANEQAVSLTRETGFAHYSSRSGSRSGRRVRRAAICSVCTRFW